MRNRKNLAIRAIICFFLLLCLLGSSVVNAEESVLINGSFAELDEDGMPIGWYADAYGGIEGSTFAIEEKEGKRAAHLVNQTMKDARYAQVVNVEPSTLYELHGYIYADASNGWGANLSIASTVYGLSTEQLYLTEGWQEVSMYGYTGSEQTQIIVFARLGGYSGEAIGEAWFADISLTPVDDIPEGFYLMSWDDSDIQYYYEDYEDDWIETEVYDEQTENGSWKLLTASILYGLIFLLIARYFSNAPYQIETQNSRKESLLFGILLLFGLIIRLFIASIVPGYDVDVGCFRAWANQMAISGPAGFYHQVGFSDYPPAYMLLLWPIGILGNLFGGTSDFLIKLPPILGDMVLCLVLFMEGKKHFSFQTVMAICALFIVNPLILCTGAAWAQIDSLLTLLLALTVLFAIRHQWRAALPCYVAAVLLKPQALMFGPLGLAALVLDVVRVFHNKDKAEIFYIIREVLLGLWWMLAAAVAITLPFHPAGYRMAIGVAVIGVLLVIALLLSKEKWMNRLPKCIQNWINTKHETDQLWLRNNDAPLSPAMKRNIAAAASILVIILLYFIWAFLIDDAWLINLYTGTLSEYNRVTANACNLYFLFGKNWSYQEWSVQPSIMIAIVLLIFLPILIAEWKHFKRKNKNPLTERSDRVRVLTLGIICAIWLLICIVLQAQNALSYANLGLCMILLSVSLAAILLFASGNLKQLPLVGSMMLLILFDFGPMMHERYLVPAVALLFIAYFQSRDKRILLLAVAVTISGFLNVGCVLDRNIRIGGAEGHLDAPDCYITSDMAPLEYISAALNCLCASFSLYLCCDLCPQEGPVCLMPEQRSGVRVKPTQQEKQFRKLTRLDWILMISVTIAYAVLAFVNLGSTKAPQNAWVASSPREQIVIDLGKEKDFHILYYGGIHSYDSDFTIEIGNENEEYTQSYTASMKIGECFKWRYLGAYTVSEIPVTLQGRYIRITADHYDLTLYEMLFRDAETSELLSASVLSDNYENQTALALLDEQDTLEGEPGWYNSTYFDEIYHARTAYEHLHGMQPYETTHPPLGKLFMSFFISIFGMTPFGWRFAGALAGVLMLPCMYLLGHLLFKRKYAGLGCMLLMAFDLMHFTQTRIATIDSFVVLFILWADYCMLQWFFLQDDHTPFWKTLIPLGLSGLFMGLSIASKWTGCYNGVGLAICFFWGIWRRYRHVRQIKADKSLVRKENKRILLTIASCFIFFLFVPAVIYYLSYIPYFAPSGGVTVSRIIDAAVGMFEYHSIPGLGMDHPYYSPWYQWPIIGKPMFYASSDFEPAGMQSSIMAMGNPAVWWGGLLGLIGVVALWLKQHTKENYALSLYADEDRPHFALLLIFFAAQFLPWTLVPRGTYIYHYFPSVPFIILCTELCLETWATKHPKSARIVHICFIAIAGILFVAFFPYASGITVPQEWLDAMRWFKNWIYY